MGSMIGVIVGLVGNPTPMSGVSDDLSMGVEEDMVDLERLLKKLENGVAKSGEADVMPNTR